MVSNLEYFRRDPMFPKRDRGAGYYYHRGKLTQGQNGRGTRNPPSMRGSYWSKYDEKLDGVIKHRRTKVADPIKKNRLKGGSPHKADYKTTGANRKTKRASDSRVKGYF